MYMISFYYVEYNINELMEYIFYEIVICINVLGKHSRHLNI